MQKSLFILLLGCIISILIIGVGSAGKLDLDGVCKITQLRNDHLLVQRGQWKSDGNHTCDSVDLYENERDSYKFIKLLTCEDAEKYYERYKGKEYIRKDKK